MSFSNIQPVQPRTLQVVTRVGRTTCRRALHYYIFAEYDVTELVRADCRSIARHRIANGQRF